MAAAIAARLTPKRIVLVLGVLFLALCIAAVLGLVFGHAPLDLGEALRDPQSRARNILVSRRGSIVMMAAVLGAALAVSGCVLQALLRNPLADPFVLGVSGGAALGGTLSLALGGGALSAWLVARAAGLPGGLGTLVGAMLALGPTTIAAVIGAVLATLVVYLAGSFGDRLSTYGALLAGVVVNALASAAITFLKVISPPERVGDLLHWLAGSLGDPSGEMVLGVAIFEALGIGVILLFASDLNLLSLGDEGAASLGVHVERVRRLLFLATSFCVAAAVAVSGLIGFVGLIIPHVFKLWLGPDQRLLLPASAIGGAAFLVLSDMLARLLFRVFGQTLPVGVLTAMIGGPIFLWLLRRAGKALA